MHNQGNVVQHFTANFGRSFYFVLFLYARNIIT